VKLRSLILAAPLALALAPAADAAGWKQVTAPDGANTDQVSLLRTADGTLHVAWRHGAPGGDSLMHTAIGRDGRIGATSTVVSGWADVQNPAIVGGPGGIRLFWGSIRSTQSTETNDAMSTALSPDGGTTWALQEGNVVQDNAQAYASPTAAATLPDGTPLQAWYGTLGTWVHAGLTPATPNFDFQAPLGSYGNLPGIAVGADGRAVLAWYSNANGHLGVYAQDVAADGSPVGAAVRMPQTSDMQIGQTGRTPIAARTGGGLFIAYATGYPSLNRIRVWRVGASRSTLVGKAAGGASATVASDRNGRVWVVWEDDHSADPLVFARRSNRSATAWGARVRVGRPKHAISAYDVDASAIGASALDVFGSFALNSGTPLATYTRRILPGLTLLAAGAPRRGTDAKVRFTVRDAGDPVDGAKVRAGGDSGRTDGKGKVTLTVHAGRRVTAHATAPGYTAAARALKIRAARR
jgi:hypothetical protein